MVSRRVTTEEFIRRARLVHGDRYDYSLSKYEACYKKLAIICSKHGIFYQSPDNHIRNKAGCPVCAGNQSYTVDSFVKKARKVHGNKYDYSKVDYKNNKTCVEIICPKHGSFWQTPDKHINLGNGCPKCAVTDREHTMVERYGVGHALQGSQFKKQIKQKSLRKYGVDNPAKNEIIKLQIKATKLKNGTYHTSSTEERAYAMLRSIFGDDDVIRQYFSDEYPFACDFYIESRNLYIELNAHWTHDDHWFDENSSVDMALKKHWEDRCDKEHPLYESALETWTVRDVKKRECAEANKLNYAVFWDNELQDFKEWIDNNCPDRHDYKLK